MSVLKLDGKVRGKVIDILKHDNPNLEFRLTPGTSAIFLDIFNKEFTMHNDDLKQIEIVLDKKFGGMCIRDGITISFV